MSNRLRWSLGLALIASLGLFWFLQPHPSHQILVSVAKAPTGGDFTAESSKGKVSLSDFKGKWVYLYFGYTFCPDICPTNLGNLSGAYHQLTNQEKSQIQFLFFSVDPKRDTPQRLAEYSQYFDMNLIGLTSNKANIDHITQQYGAVYAMHKEANSDDYSVDHSAFTYVISPQGKLMMQLPHGTSAKEFLENIRHNLSTH